MPTTKNVVAPTLPYSCHMYISISQSINQDTVIYRHVVGESEAHIGILILNAEIADSPFVCGSQFLVYFLEEIFMPKQ